MIRVAKRTPEESTVGPVAYLVKMFPRLSETFIANELVELRRRGVEIRLISLMRPSGPAPAPESELLARDAYYAPAIAWRPRPPEEDLRAILRDHAILFRRGPRRYLHALALVARRFSPTAWKRFLQAGSVARHCQDEQVRHIHAGFAHTPASVAFWAARLTGLTFSLTAHAKDLYLSRPASLRRKIDAARFVYTCTEANGAHLRGLGSATPVHVGYHGCDLSRFGASVVDGPPASTVATEEDTARISPPVILSVGRLVAKKGLSDLLTAAAILRDRRVPFELVLVGDGPLRRSLAEQVSRLDLDRCVRFTGSMPPSKVREEYARARVVTLPSIVLKNGDRDGIPNVLVEAMAMGVPVVSTRQSAISELVRHGATGLLVDPASPEQLARALEDTLSDRESALRRAAAARLDVRRRFDLHENSARIAGLLRRHCAPTRCLYVSADLGVPVRGHKGASAHVRQIAERLAEAGVDTKIVTPVAGPTEPEGNAVSVAVLEAAPALWIDSLVQRCRGDRTKRYAREARRLLYNVTLFRELSRRLREDRPDFVYERYALCAVAAGILCRRRGVPWLVEVNAPLADEEAAQRGLVLARLTRFLERWILRHADHCFTVTPVLRRWAIESGAHPDHVSVLANGVDGSRFHPGVDETKARREWGFGVGGIVVAFAGSLKPWHGGMLLLEAFASARSLRPDLRLVFIGDGPEGKALRRRVRSLGLGEVVRFTGAVVQDEVPGFLRAADILAAPYLAQERFYFSPLKIVEYLAVGRPVVASRIGEIPEWVDTTCGRLVRPGRRDELSAALVELAADQRMREALGRAAAKRVRGEDWSDRADRILETAGALRTAATPSGAQSGKQSPPRVGYILKMFPRFSETFVLNEILELERQGTEIRVFSMKQPTGARQPGADRVRAATTVLPRGASLLAWGTLLAHGRCLRRDRSRYLKALRFALGRRDIRAMIKFLQAGWIADAAVRERIGHFHAHFASGPARTAKFASMISGIPFSFTAHAKDLYWDGHRHSESHKLKKRVRLARFVVTVSRENERFIESLGFRVKEGRLRTIHIGLRPGEFPFSLPSARPWGPRPLILGVGRLIEKKGFHILLEALSRLRARGVRFRCLLAGEGPERELLEALIAERGLRGSVRLIGAVPLDRLRRRYYSRARVLAQPCVVAADGDRDGIPTVLVEAMAMGVPVISTTVSGIPEAITNGVDGFLTEPGDVTELEERLDALLLDTTLADRLARAGRARVERQFDLAQNARNLRKLFLRSIAGWPAPETASDPVRARTLPVASQARDAEDPALSPRLAPQIVGAEG